MCNLARNTALGGSHQSGKLSRKGERMEEHKPLPRPAIRYLERSPRPLVERWQELGFAPKRFESTALYERLGVLLIKRYVPTGGEVVNRR